METRYVIGLDMGTTTIKAVFFDTKENKIVTTQIEESYPIKAEHPDFIEYDPKTVRELVKCVLKRGFDTGIDPNEVAGLCSVDYTVIALLVDDEGKPLTNCVHYNDFRHLKEAEELQEKLGDLCVQRNNNYLGMFNGLPKQYWWRKHRPEIYKKTDKFVTLVAWINHELTGNWAQSRSAAGFYGNYNAYTREWDKEITELCGMSIDKFPPLADAWQVIGEVTEEAAAEWGLAKGTKVLAGADDASPVAITLGVINPGECFMSAGSGANVVVNSKNMVCHETALSYPHCIPGLNMATGVLNSTGLSYKWMRNNLAAAEEQLAKLSGSDTYEYMNALAAKSSPGSNGVIFLPYLDGDFTPNNDPNAKGVFFGLDSSTTRGDLFRAVMEGVAFSLLDCMQMLLSLGGGEPSSIVIAGGIAKSRLWLQILADVCGLPVSLPEELEGAPFGCAILCGITCGMYRDYRDAVEKAVKINRNVAVPDAKNKEIYADMYKVYKGLYPKLKSAYAELEAIKEKYK